MPLEVLIWVVMIGMLMLGAPVFVALGVSSVTVVILSDIPLAMLATDLYKIADMFPLLAVVGFVFAGALMDRGGMAEQIVEVASLAVGRVRGGLGIVTILGCMFFASMIGSGPGTVAAMGSLMIPSMIARGYSPEYAAGVSATGGTLGILIPPSNPMLVYGIIANVSISALFTSGFIPGLIVGSALMLTAYVLARRAGFRGDMEMPDGKTARRIILRNIWSLLAPVIILGGIYAGICTPVEASIVAVWYSLFVGFVITKRLSRQAVFQAIRMAVVSTGTIIIVVGVSNVFGRFLTMYQIPQQLAANMLAITQNPALILIMIMLLLFFLGMFMETLATIVVLAPIFIPIIKKVGIDPVYFGIFWVLTNEVALLTPPLGVNLFIAMNLSGQSLEKVAKGALPYIIVLSSLTFASIFFPEIVTFLPKYFGMKW
ncbi:MAG: TRAP transporter large permease [Desulfovibrio sp.]|jgi:C4-dicarboxylate transporter DctM subunit|nr:TRAP transporter large permease [Desulfovibrio sp.]